MRDLVIYTDLDGSLLDHHSYSHAAADGLLARLERQGIPVVPVSSKTRAELLPLRAELHNSHPFIVENGAAVLMPRGYFTQQPEGTEVGGGFWVKPFSLPRTHWLAIIESLAVEFAGAFDQFAALDPSAIGALTGLDAVSARRAAAREYGEPIHWRGGDSERARFVAALEERGANILTGGRFLHVSGDCDKGRALQWLNERYAAPARGKAPVSIAVGDSHNDVAMLEAADYALIIRSPVHPPPALARSDRVLVSRTHGPGGWVEGVAAILGQLGRSV